MTPELHALIAAYFNAKSVWEAIFDADSNKAGDTPEWEALCMAEEAILAYRCRSLEEVSAKVAFLLGYEPILDAYANDYTKDGEIYSVAFLRSLIIEEGTP